MSSLEKSKRHQELMKKKKEEEMLEEKRTGIMKITTDDEGFNKLSNKLWYEDKLRYSNPDPADGE